MARWHSKNVRSLNATCIAFEGLPFDVTRLLGSVLNWPFQGKLTIVRRHPEVLRKLGDKVKVGRCNETERHAGKGGERLVSRDSNATGQPAAARRKLPRRSQVWQAAGDENRRLLKITAIFCC